MGHFCMHTVLGFLLLLWRLNTQPQGGSLFPPLKCLLFGIPNTIHRHVHACFSLSLPSNICTYIHTMCHQDPLCTSSHFKNSSFHTLKNDVISLHYKVTCALNNTKRKEKAKNRNNTRVGAQVKITLAFQVPKQQEGSLFFCGSQVDLTVGQQSRIFCFWTLEGYTSGC